MLEQVVGAVEVGAQAPPARKRGAAALA